MKEKERETYKERIKRARAHHVPESVDEELLRDVVFAVGILEGEIEFVVLVEHVEARLRLRARTAQTAARAVNVHLDIFRELSGIMHALISGMAVGNEPGDLITQRRDHRVSHARAQ